MARIGIKEFYSKIKERFKGRLQKKYKLNWPELDTYCGCCNLSTGIYIRTIMNLIITVTTIAINSAILSRILDIGPVVFNTNLTVNENYLALQRPNPQQDLLKLYMMYNAIVAYYILWLGYKVIYISLLLLTIFAMYKRNGTILKILLYISIPNLILDIFISSLAALVIEFNVRIVIVISILVEGYNILALYSEYKRMMGKSRVRHKDIESEPGTPTVPPLINPPQRDLQNNDNEVHCRGCNCTANQPQDSGNVVVSTQLLTDPPQTTLIASKEIDENELNYAITGILNPINSVRCIENETARGSNRQNAERPNTLDLPLDMAKDEKAVITDEPVIYDVNQLNVGKSPVIEDRDFVPSRSLL